MQDQVSLPKLGLLVVLVLAGTAWTVTSYLASKQDPGRTVSQESVEPVEQIGGESFTQAPGATRGPQAG